MLEPVSDPIRIFIGFDQVESVAYHTLCHSIERLATSPVSITPIKSDQLKTTFSRERDPKQSNDFSFTRWLVPWLCNYEGYAIFMDCDMLLRTDIAKLWNLKDYRYAVQCVKHEYTPRDEIKYLDNIQYKYHKKNWSSVMIFNNKKCKALTPKYVNEASGMELHQFQWIDEYQVGGLPRQWNHLVGEYDYNPNAKLVHFTVGGPYFFEYANCDYADEWFAEKEHMLNCVQRGKVSER